VLLPLLLLPSRSILLLVHILVQLSLHMVVLVVDTLVDRTTDLRRMLLIPT
jgi:hypothetical protein